MELDHELLLHAAARGVGEDLHIGDFVGAREVRFVAKDVKREIEVVDNAGLQDGTITVRARTFNILYLSKGFGTEPELGDPVTVPLRALWGWGGADFGGPVAEDDVLTGSYGTHGPPDPLGHRR